MSKPTHPSSQPVAQANRPDAANWFEHGVAALIVLVALWAAYLVFGATRPQTELTEFALYQMRAQALAQQTNTINRDSLCIPLSAYGRSLDAQIPTNSRVFLLDVLGKENEGKLGYFYFLTYYLFPREVGISISGPAKFTNVGMVGESPESLQQLTDAGYDLALKMTDQGGWQTAALRPLPQSPPRIEAIDGSDRFIAFLLPLAVALAGTRLVRWLAKDLNGVLSLGELLACGLALGAFVSTQAILALRLAGARLEGFLAIGFAVWAVIELALLLKHAKGNLPKPGPQHLWWALLIPAALLMWRLFRLAGLEGLLEFDAVSFWAWKAKLFHELAGSELWVWLRNPQMGYAHLDYPLLVPMLHSFTYGALGHVNEFVTKFWNQWMLLFLAWAVLGAGQFPRKRPWAVAAAATIVVVLPMTLEFARTEGGTTPMLFFTVLGSMQLAMGMAENSAGRLRLGLALLIATAMVKFEGIVVLGLWGLILLAGRSSRAQFWPLQRIGWGIVVALLFWLPYAVFRLKGPVAHPESAWLSEFFHNIGTVLQIAPMTWVAFVSRRFFNNEFVVWSAPDNQNAVWDGKWTGLESLVDQATLGIGWLCLFLVVAAWWRGGQVRWTLIRLFLLFLVFASFIAIVWSSARSNPLNYTNSLAGSDRITGGRYLYPVLMSWFVAGTVVLMRSSSGGTKTSPPRNGERRRNQPGQ